jgi:hypothetical protein
MGRRAYLDVNTLLQKLPQCLTSFHTQCVSPEMDLFDLGRVYGGEVWLYVCFGVEGEAFAVEGEDGGHGVLEGASRS